MCNQWSGWLAAETFQGLCMAPGRGDGTETLECWRTHASMEHVWTAVPCNGTFRFRHSLLVVDTLILVAVLVGDRNKPDLPTEQAFQVDVDLQSMSRLSGITGSPAELQAALVSTCKACMACCRSMCEYTAHVRKETRAHIRLAIVVAALGLDALVVPLACRARVRAAQPEETSSLNVWHVWHLQAGVHAVPDSGSAWCTQGMPLRSEAGAELAACMDSRLRLSAGLRTGSAMAASGCTSSHLARRAATASPI